VKNSDLTFEIFAFFFTECLYVFRKILKTNLISCIDFIKQLVFTVETDCVLCKLGIQMLYGRQTSGYLNR